MAAERKRTRGKGGGGGADALTKGGRESRGEWCQYHFGANPT